MCHWVRVKLWFFVDMSFNSWYILMSFNSWYTTIQFVVEIRGSWNWTTNWMTSWNWTTNWMTYVPRIEWHIRGTFFFFFRGIEPRIEWHMYHELNDIFVVHSFFWSTCDSMRVMGWLRLVGFLKIYVSLQNIGLFWALLQKRPIFLSILLIVATPYLPFGGRCVIQCVLPCFFFLVSIHNSMRVPFFFWVDMWFNACCISFFFKYGHIWR